jgi:hypothetical protein
MRRYFGICHGRRADGNLAPPKYESYAIFETAAFSWPQSTKLQQSGFMESMTLLRSNKSTGGAAVDERPAFRATFENV